jgi:Na+/melibiose symporter-like transporter
MDVNLFNWFLKQDSAWAILFCFMFLMFLKTTNDREQEHKKQLEEFQSKLETDIRTIQANTNFVVSCLKLILEKELKRRKKDV